MAKPSAYVLKLQAQRKLAGKVNRDLTIRWCTDAAVLAAREVFHRKGEKLAEFQEAYMKWSRYIAETALADAKDDKELTYTKHKIDGLLKEALGEEFFLPWEERYRL